MAKRIRARSLVIKIDDTELAQVHALAGDADEAYAVMFRRWIAERYGARFGNASPPDTRTKFGNAVKPSTKSGESQ